MAPTEEYEVEAGQCRIFVSQALYSALLGDKVTWTGSCDRQGYAEGIGIWRRFDSTGRLIAISRREMRGGKTFRTAGTFGMNGSGQVLNEHGYVNPAALPMWALELQSSGRSRTQTAQRRQAPASDGDYARRHEVSIALAGPVLATANQTRHRTIASPDFNPAGYFLMSFKFSSAIQQPVRIAAQAGGGYRNDYLNGWFASVPASGARCIAFRYDLLGLQILRQGLELPTALPGMGETATANQPTTAYPGSESQFTAIFVCDAPLRPGDLISGQIRLMIGRDGRWTPDEIPFRDRPMAAVSTAP